MGFRSDILIKALDEVKRSHDRNTAEYESRKQEVYARFPRLQDIDTELALLGSRLIETALSGNGNRDGINQKILDLNAERNEILKQNGVGSAPSCECGLCGDTGYTDGKLCSCVKERAKRLTTEEMTSDVPIQNCRFDNFSLDFYSQTPDENGHSPYESVKNTLALSKKFADEFPSGKNLFFCGATGLGKTHLSLAIANAVIEKGYGVVYDSAQNLVTKMSREQFSRSAEMPYTDAVLSADLLILDDLGTEFSTSFSSSVIYNVINTRQLKGLSTVISTNLSLKEIEAAYSQRVLSRIIGSYTMRLFFGDDIRQLKLALAAADR